MREDGLDNTARNSGAVYIFTRSGSRWSRQDYLKGSNTTPGDQFGWSVALSGDTLVVGVPNEDSGAAGVYAEGADGAAAAQADNSASSGGAVYVFTRTGGAWAQRAYIKASNTGSQDKFGNSVALSESGGTLAVAAPEEDSNAQGVNAELTGGTGTQADNSTRDSGAVYIFTRTGTDNTTWTQQAYIKASNTGRDDRFGSSIALSGDKLAVGATEEDNGTGPFGNQNDNTLRNSGAVYLFTRDAGTWRQEQYLKATNFGENDQFGGSVALSGDTLAVGARYEDSGSKGVDGSQGDNSVENSGAVYLFTRSGSTWNRQAYIKASNTGGSIVSRTFKGNGFGASIALSGDTLVVGAPDEESSAVNVNGNQDDNSMFASGAVYLFTRSGGTWSQKAYIKASNTDAEDGFGASAALSGNTIAVGSPNEKSNATDVNGDENDNSIFLSAAPAAGGAGAVYVRRIAP